MKRLKNGFTLIELIVVIAVIGILATISVLTYSSIRAHARDSQRSSNVTILSESLEKYYDQNGEYPGCSAMTKPVSTVTSTTLPNTTPDVFTAPSAPDGTNSISCNSLTSGSGPDSFAYVGDGSQTCLTGSSCLQFTLQYREETSGNIISVQSRRRTQIATSGDITDLSGSTSPFVLVKLTWSSTKNAVGYRVQASANSNFTSIVSDTTVATNAASISGLSANTQYYFRVAPDAIGNQQGSWSNVKAIATSHIPTPASPNAVADSTTPTSKINFSWSSVTNASSYTVRYDDNSSFSSPTVVNGLTGTSYSVSGLTAGTTLYFQVRAMSSDDTGTYTSTVNATSKVMPPGGIVATANSGTQVTVSWNAAVPATNYTVEYASNSSFTGSSFLTGVTSTSKAVTGLAQGQPAYFRVYALVGAISSVASSSASTITPINKPATPVMSVDSYNWVTNSHHIVNYISYCPAGTSLNIGPSYNGGYEATGFVWTDANSYLPWGFSDYWTRGSVWPPGSPIRYRTNYSCSTAYKTSPVSDTAENIIYIY